MIMDGQVSNVCLCLPHLNKIVFTGFDLISIVNPGSWPFAAAAEGSAADKTGPTEPEANKTHSSSGIEDLFQDSPSVVSAPSEKPKKDAKTDIMSLFDKVNFWVALSFEEVLFLW